mmetsp:Transcript_12438/g.31834  ORF Transcript_12438/g.31834 Transcript_12438/m.31834 type:complete len:333 (-) Transcript_12438:187-1185(-)
MSSSSDSDSLPPSSEMEKVEIASTPNDMGPPIAVAPPSEKVPSTYFSLMKASIRSFDSAGRRNSGGSLHSRTASPLAFPPHSSSPRSSDSENSPSSSERTSQRKPSCDSPNLRCSPAHRMQRKTPRLQQAHAVPLRWQSKQRSFRSTLASRFNRRKLLLAQGVRPSKCLAMAPPSGCRISWTYWFVANRCSSRSSVCHRPPSASDSLTRYIVLSSASSCSRHPTGRSCGQSVRRSHSLPWKRSKAWRRSTDPRCRCAVSVLKYSRCPVVVRTRYRRRHIGMLTSPFRRFTNHPAASITPYPVVLTAAAAAAGTAGPAAPELSLQARGDAMGE